ncbi:MAG: cytochrome d ubiquinol oxidase subunit II [Nitrospirae bacterium]|nr:cytochrome d ubiquinol oxidase subunit II [Nitrospirota bacterium]
MDLNAVWFFLILGLTAGYAILDGFDLGVGVLHLFARDNSERRININAIGPVWDGNEVWLLVAGGSLFAVFPMAYAAILSGFYLLLILLLTSLIFRAVSLEFRNKVSSAAWQRLWDWSFGLGSLLASLLFGIMLGNILQGVSIDQEGIFTGHFLSQFNLFSILTGLLILTVFVMHGGIYMTLKTEGLLLERMRRAVSMAWFILIILFPTAVISTYYVSPFLFRGLLRAPFPGITAVILLAAILCIPAALWFKRYALSFLASSVMIACGILLTGLSLFPRLIPSGIDPAYSLTIYNAAAGPRTLTAMLVITLISLPLVISYTIYIHRVFKGKVAGSEESHY